MIRRSLVFAAAAAFCAQQVCAQDELLTTKVRSAVCKATTVEGFALNGFVTPFALEQVDGLLPDAHIAGLYTKVKDLLKAVVASLIAAGWDNIHTSAKFLKALEVALYGEFGHLGLVELMHQLNLQDSLSKEAKENYNRFGIGYVKAVAGTVLKHVVSTVAKNLPSFGSKTEDKTASAEATTAA